MLNDSILGRNEIIIRGKEFSKSVIWSLKCGTTSNNEREATFITVRGITITITASGKGKNQQKLIVFII